MRGDNLLYQIAVGVAERIGMKIVNGKSMKILVVDDEPIIRLGLLNTLAQAGYGVDCAQDASAWMELFRKGGYDLVITDLVMPGGRGGLDVLRDVKDANAIAGVIVMTAFGTVKTAVEAMRLGAFDYITKPFEPEELLIIIERFVAQKNLEQENLMLREEIRHARQIHGIVGESQAMKRLCETIETIGGSDASVLIYGETGTGKELAANALHDLSPRSDKPFIKINCAAVPETLFESELFGYEKGAFTGAQQRRKGKIEAAQGGTVLFDEIGDMPLAIQAKLLRVIEERKVDRLGAHEAVSVDVRFLYATAKNLKQAVKDGSFREDLYYRINVLPLQIPPLRERPGDIPFLARHFLDEFCRRSGKTGLAISESAMAALSGYRFPGNVRELKHAVEMAVTLCTQDMITLVHLPAEIREASCGEAYLAAAGPGFLSDQVRRLERELITKALEEADGKKAAAADSLGICRRTLWKKMRDLQFPEAMLEKDD